SFRQAAAPPPPAHSGKTYYELNIAETKLLRALHKPVPPTIRIEDIEKHSYDLFQLQIKMALFLDALPRRAVQRALKPLSAPSPPKAPPGSATKKKKSHTSARHPHPPRSSRG